MIDFELTEQQIELRDRTVAFVRDKLIPLEHTDEPTRVSDEFRHQLVALGHEAGLVAPHAPTEWGGLGLDHVSITVVGQIATEVRGFRIYDGPSEGHRSSIARRLGR